MEYLGDDYYEGLSANATFNLAAAELIMDVYALYITVGGDESITVYIPADATGNVSLMINDVDYGNATIVDGNAEFVILNLVANSYKRIISYGVTVNMTV